jgi:hypothetical protein
VEGATVEEVQEDMLNLNTYGEPLDPADDFMEDIKSVARSYIGNPILHNADAVACDPILQLARELEYAQIIERSH